MRHGYRTLWLSDIHLGTSACRAADLLRFLDEVSAEVIYLAGDIVDLERMKARPAFPLLHRRLIGRFLDLARRGTRIVYVPGNHDMELRELAGRSLCGIDVVLETTHACVDGKRLLVTHGDCLDQRVGRGTYAEQIGAAAYRWLVSADVRVNRLRSHLGADYSSFSTKIKLRLSSANEYIRRFEEAAAQYAATRGFDGIVCGHIHRPCVRQIDGVWYANDGDWVEHRSALAETFYGEIRLLHWAAGSVVAEPRAYARPVAA